MHQPDASSTTTVYGNDECDATRTCQLRRQCLQLQHYFIWGQAEEEEEGEADGKSNEAGFSTGGK